MRTFISLMIAAVTAAWLAAPALVAADDTEIEHRSTYSEKKVIEPAPDTVIRERSIETGPAAVEREKRTSETTIKSNDNDNDNSDTKIESKTKVEHDD